MMWFRVRPGRSHKLNWVSAHARYQGHKQREVVRFVEEAMKSMGWCYCEGFERS